MANFFVPGKGCVYSPTKASGGGWYSLSGLSEGQSDSPILILGVQLTDTDLTQPVTALGNIKLIHVFGQNFGDVQVMGSVLCGPADSNGGSFEQVISYFDKVRVSKDGRPVSLSIPGGKNYKVFITGMGLSQPDAELHVQPFMFFGMIANPSGGQ